jgi:cell wall-associated NlpC family hydrolase
VRLLGAALFALILAGGTAAVSSAGPSQQDLDSAKAKLRELNRTLDQLVEDFDVATLKLHALEGRLADAREQAIQSQRAADQARAQLGERARIAYEQTGSDLDVLLGATSFTEFNESLQFLESLTKLDADAATMADVTGRQAEVAAASLRQTLQERRDLLDTLNARQKQIEASIADQQALIRDLEKELTEQALQEVLSQPGSKGGGSPPPTPDPSPPPPPPPPPPPDPGADTAVQAAYSVIGVKYTWGGDDPDEGFDCSGLTMWSWAQAGVSLPHSSSAQYGAIPHVSKDAIQPGDLLFFYQPISHVAIYVGGNQMIHSTHPGGSVTLESVSDYWWAEFSGAGRPG